LSKFYPSSMHFSSLNMHSTCQGSCLKNKQQITMNEYCRHAPGVKK